MGPVILQNGGSVLYMWPTALRLVEDDGELSEPIWFIEMLHNDINPEWVGTRAHHPQSKMLRIRQEYLELGYKIVASALPANRSSPKGPPGSQG